MEGKSLLSDFDETAGGAPAEPAPRAAAPAIPSVVYLYVGIAAAANLLFGYENSVVASGVTDYVGAAAGDQAVFETSFLKGALALGATIACPLAGFAQDGLGRRVTLILCCLVYLGVAALTTTSPAYAAGGFPQMAAGRVLTGCIIGVFSSTVPMYIAELSPPAVRGALVTVNQVCICAGILLGYMSSWLFKGAWRVQFAAATPLAALSLAAFVLVTPYSPRWLMSRGREAEARAVLASTLGAAAGAAAVDAEVASMRAAIELTAGANRLALLAEPHTRWSICIGVMGSLMQQWVGVNAVNGFAPQIFESAGSSPDEAHVQTIYIGVAKLVFVVVALLLMDRVGRKPLLLAGCAGMALSAAGLAASYSLPVPARGNTAVACLVLYMAFFEISLGPILWLLLSELYPVQIKGVAMSIGSTTCWCVASSAAVETPLAPRPRRLTATRHPHPPQAHDVRRESDLHAHDQGAGHGQDLLLFRRRVRAVLCVDPALHV